MKTINLRQLIIAAVIIGISFGHARADKQQLQTLLDKEFIIELEDVTITQALERISNRREIDIVLSDEAIWKLPDGEKTKISVKLEGALSEALEEMLNTFFMRYAVGNDQIVIYPRPELEHIIGKPSTEQLELLRKIYTAKIYTVGMSPDELATMLEEEGLESVSFVPYQITKGILSIMKNIATEGTIALSILLEQVGEASNMPCWYISKIDSSNPSHVINFVNENEFIDVKINQVVDISYQDERADVILKELAFMAGMELDIEKQDADWLEETITVEILNTRLRQVFENITRSLNGNIGFAIYTINIQQYRDLPLVAGSAGSLGHTGGTTQTRGTGRVTPSFPGTTVTGTQGTTSTGSTAQTRGTRMGYGTTRTRTTSGTTGNTRGPVAATSRTVGATPRSVVVTGTEGYVGKISIPMDDGNYYIEFMLRESDLTEPLKKLRAEKIQAIIEKMEESLKTN